MTDETSWVVEFDGPETLYVRSAGRRDDGDWSPIRLTTDGEAIVTKQLEPILAALARIEGHLSSIVLEERMAALEAKVRRSASRGRRCV